MAEGGSKLSEEQIYECLKDLNVPVRMNDLKVPCREFIVRVLECFVRDLQIDIAGVELRPWESVCHIEDGDIYEEPQLLLILAMTVNHITNPCGLNISIKDLIEPKPKRTKKILNYIIVFWKYYLQKYGRFHAIEASYENERKKSEDVIAQNESLDEQYNDLLNTFDKLQPCKEELSSIIKAREEKNSKLSTESETLQTEYQNLKVTEFNLKEKINATQVNYIRAKERLDELSLLILSSPKQKQINTEIQTLNDKIKAKDVETKECESKYKDGIKKLQFLEECQKEEEKVFKTLNEAGETDRQLRETVKTMLDIHQRISEEEDSDKRLQMDLERKEEWKFQQEQKSAKFVLNNKKQLETLREVLKLNQKEESKLKKNVEYIKTGITHAQASIDSESDSILEIIEKCKEANAQSEERKNQYICKMQGISDQFKCDCTEVVEVIRAAFSNSS